MEFLTTLFGYAAHAFDVLLHLDRYLGAVIQDYGAWTYLILFLIVFCETGLVVTPFLPGDSLMFVVGTFAAQGYLDIYKIWPLLILAAIIGDNTNYAIGNYIGPKVFQYEDSRFFRKEYLLKTHAFYEKYGGKAIILCKYVPIIRTFAPFVAGVGAMTYPRFLMFNVVGGFTWVTVLMMGGYFFGNMPIIKNNFSVMIIAIIFVSVLPPILEVIRRTRAARAARLGAVL